MNIALTGASGFVGQNLKKYLICNNFNIKIIDRDKLQTCDFNLLDNVDVVVHLAGKAHDLKNVSNPQEYYDINFKLTKQIFDAFIVSSAKIFIILSTVKAVADELDVILTEDLIPNPQTHYGKSKLLAEQYIQLQPIPEEKRVYILRPCMIHGPGNKGNLSLLYKIISKGIPWPLGEFDNKRSFCSIENLCFIIKELIERSDIPSGIFNVSDNEPLSTNDLIKLIAASKNKRFKIYKISKSLTERLARAGDYLNLPLNTERLRKLTASYVVNNFKITNAIGKPLPVSSREGLLKTFQSFTT